MKGGRRRWLLERTFAGKQHAVPLPTVQLGLPTTPWISAMSFWGLYPMPFRKTLAHRFFVPGGSPGGGTACSGRVAVRRVPSRAAEISAWARS